MNSLTFVILHSMSSRALRRAQKERELAQQVPDSASESDDTEDLISSSAAKPSAFALLGDVNEDEGETNDEEDGSEVLSGDVESRQAHQNLDADEEEEEEEEEEQTTTASQATSKSSAKKKKKKKSKKASTTPLKPSVSQNGLDEIDRALQSLTTDKGENNSTLMAGAPDPAVMEVCKFLSIDSASLRVENEMRRLFGKVAFEPEHTEEGRGHGNRQRLQPGEGASLSEAVSGRQAQGGPGLSAVLRRRNIFIPGKEDWPKATGGGLTMDIVGTTPGGIVEYTYVHNNAYQNQQKEFEACVSMMDPSMMVNLLRFNPYHVSTLLQVSEIAKQDRDPATSGELLERALFSFGRAVHSSFAQNLAAGKARLDFKRPENREFWLAAWRYINNIGLRATWRTAYEWTKLLLSLDPENDPYCVRLVIDQLAFRARQPQNFLDLSRSQFFSEKWSSLPNIQYSRSIAMRQLDPKSTAASDTLVEAVERFPWVGARLFQELGIDKVPRSIWGSTASSPVDIMYTELYLNQGLDLWKLPETSKFLADVVTQSDINSSARVNTEDISLNEARFTYLTDKPALIGLIPRSITSTIESASDPLPPADSIRSYTTGNSNRRDFSSNVANRPEPNALAASDPGAFIQEINSFQRFFELLIPGFTDPPSAEAEATFVSAPAGRQSMPGAFSSHDSDSDGEENERDADDEPSTPAPDLAALEISEQDVDEAISRSGLSMAQLRTALTRFVSLREALVGMPGQTVRAENGDEVVMLSTGMARVTNAQGHRIDEGVAREREEEDVARALGETGNEDDY